MLSLVKMLIKWEVGGCALNSHGNNIVDHGKSWKNHGIVFMNFCGNPDASTCCMQKFYTLACLCGRADWFESFLLGLK